MQFIYDEPDHQTLGAWLWGFSNCLLLVMGFMICKPGGSSPSSGFLCSLSGQPGCELLPCKALSTCVMLRKHQVGVELCKVLSIGSSFHRKSS